MTKALRDARIIMPGIERVAQKNSPWQHDLRYCPGEVGAGEPERVLAIAAAVVQPPPKLAPLQSQQLCDKVRFNHFELWYAQRRGAGGT